MKPKVFISVGSASSAEQADAADMIFQSLQVAGLSPRQMQKNEWSYEQPLRAIRRVIEECHGVVIVAFTRYQFHKGMERRKDGREERLIDVRLPTVWNQIEAAMGYTRGLPLLVIAEHGLKDDGLLEARYDWEVFWTDFSRKELRSDAFSGILESWKRRVIEHADTFAREEEGGSLEDLSTMPVYALLGRLSVPQLWKAGSAIVGLMVSIATLSFRLGAGKWPWQ